jgi:hypothetical protein
VGQSESNRSPLRAAADSFGVPLLVLTPEQLERLIFHVLPERMELSRRVSAASDERDR